MRPFKAQLKRGLASIPPFRRWFSQIDALRKRTDDLERDLNAANWQAAAVQQELKTRTDELARVKAAHPAMFPNGEPLWMPPGHFYSPIPAEPVIRANEEEIFRIPAGVRGVDLHEPQQLDLLRRFAGLYQDQPFTSEKVSGRRYMFENPNYSYGDAVVLYCMMRHLSPKRIVEVGSGYSSCAMLDVNELFFSDSIAFTFIDPYPQLLRSLITSSDLRRARILGQPVQEVDLDVFRELQDSDILFIDSSHVAKTGSDVNYLVFKILPLLNKGVHIHFHDIFYPFEYPPDWVMEGRAWNEAYLLRAFLQYNQAFEIEFFATYLLHKHRDLLSSALPLFTRNPGANLWLKKVLQNEELNRAKDLQKRPVKPAPSRIDPFQPAYASWLRDGWYRPESDHCWMGQSASLQLRGPADSNRKLRILAHSPHAGGATLSAVMDGVELEPVKLAVAGPVEAEFTLPQSLAGRPVVTLHLYVDKAHRVEGDIRALGLSVHSIEIV